MVEFKPTMLQKYDVYVTFGWEKVKPFDNALHVAALQFRIGEFFQILVPYAHPFTLP